MKDKKDRYVYKFIDGYGFFIDTETNIEYFINKFLVDLLNNQDKHIKGLENSNQKLQDYYWGRINKLDELYNKDLEERLEENQQLKEENGYIIFSDGYDANGNKIQRQEFVTYKDKCKELIEENKKLKQLQRTRCGK